MEWISYAFLGLIQGITEFLPVSSSGHLFLTQLFLEWEPSLSLEIFFHAASLSAVIVYFWKDILKIVQKTCSKDCLKNPDGILGLKLLLSTILTVPVALLIESKFDNILSLNFVAGTLIITGILILVAENIRPEKERVFTWAVAVFLGLVQGIAAIPGISRSGITIAFLIILGLNRKKSAEISFLLAIPTILGALIFALRDETFSVGGAEIMGFLVCVGASLAAITWMMRLIQRRWIWFAPYCFFLGTMIFLFGK